jgi:hypothetical protein
MSHISWLVSLKLDIAYLHIVALCYFGFYENSCGESHALQNDVNKFLSVLLTFIHFWVKFIVRGNAHDAVQDLWYSWKIWENFHVSVQCVINHSWKIHQCLHTRECPYAREMYNESYTDQCTLKTHLHVRGLLEKYPTVFFYANTWWIII